MRNTSARLRTFAIVAAAALLAVACGEAATITDSATPVPAGPAPTGTAASLLTNNHAIINPAALGGMDLSRDVWLAWDGNEYLSLFELESTYFGLRPAAHNKLLKRADGWYETQVPVAGARFTAVQFASDGRTRIWAQLPLGWSGVSQTPSRYECGTPINAGYSVSLHLPKTGYPQTTYNSWITKGALPGDTTQLFISRNLLPVDLNQLTQTWKLVGERIGWTYPEALTPTSTADGLTFRIGGTKNGGRVNAMATAMSGKTVWARFGHLATGELDGYRHPHIYLNCAEYPNYFIIGIQLP